MGAIDFIKEVETKYDVESIKVKDMEVWPFLRIPYYFAYSNKYIDGMARKYYSDLLMNRDVTRFVDTEEEFVDVILNWHTRTKKEIMDLHNGFYKQNHKESLKQALDHRKSRLLRNDGISLIRG